jgi:hypothetical protein
VRQDPLTAVLRGRLLVAVAVVSGAGLLVDLWAWRDPGSAWAHALWPVASLSAEGNVPTWFASSLLLACAVFAGAIANEHAATAAWRRHWWGIAVALGWVSLDEVAGLHEHLGGHLDTGGILYFDWVIWAAPIVLVLAVIYLQFLRALPSPVRGRLVIAAVVFVSGALVLELPLGWWTDHAGSDSLGYALIDWVEETLELVGASLALVALVAHRRSLR